MAGRFRPDDPFIARMEAKRQAEWRARIAREAERDKPGALGWAKPLGWLRLIWNGLPPFLLSLSSLAGLALAFYVLAKAVWEPKIAIAPIPIPKSLADKGYTPEVVAERLQSAVNKLRKDAQSSKIGAGRSSKISAGEHPQSAPLSTGN